MNRSKLFAPAIFVLVLAACCASASIDMQWTILMKAGELSGYSGVGPVPTDPVWLNTFVTATLSVTATSTPGTTTSPGDFQTTQSGIHFGTVGAKRVVTNKTAFGDGAGVYCWDLILETGPDWAKMPVTIGWWVPSAVENFTGWPLRVCRYGETGWDLQGALSPPTVFNGSGKNGATQVLAYLTDIEPGTTETWRVFVGPEPSCLLVVLSGMAGVSAMCVRRKRRRA